MKPMTESQARANVAEMIAKTSKRSRVRLLQLALNGFGNLSGDARRVYEAALASEVE